MGRLIDIDNLKGCAIIRPTSHESIEHIRQCGNDVLNHNDIPTAYNVEKVVAELEQQAEQYRNRGFEHDQKGFSAMADKYYGKQCSYLHAIDIVKRGGVE